MNQADYLVVATDFRAALAAGTANPEEWVTVRARVACTTPDCPGSTSVECDLGENADGVYRAICGVCGNNHESITLLFDDGELVVQ